MTTETSIYNLKELIDKHRSFYIDWARFSRESLDYDPDYSPEFPDIIQAAEESLKLLEHQLLISPKREKRMTVNEEASKLVNGPKREAYGNVETSFARVARLWSEVLGVAVTPAQVALCMIQVKVAREVHLPDRDNRVDICG